VELPVPENDLKMNQIQLFPDRDATEKKVPKKYPFVPTAYESWL